MGHWRNAPSRRYITIRTKHGSVFKAKLYWVEIFAFLTIPLISFLCAFAISLIANISFVMYDFPSVCMFVFACVRMEQIRSHSMDLHKIWCLGVFRKSVEEVQVSLKSDKINGYFTWRQLYIYCNISLNSCAEWEIFQTQFVEKKVTQSCWIIFSENRAVYEIMWDCLLEPDRPQMTIQYIQENIVFSCWVKKTRKKPALRVCNTGFPRQQWLRQSLWMLRYNYIVCLICSALSLPYAIIFLPLCIKLEFVYVRLFALLERLVHCR